MGWVLIAATAAEINATAVEVKRVHAGIIQRNGKIGVAVLYANVNGKKSLPFKGLRAICPSCGEVVISKCGALVTHHWAHKSGSECDPWAEKIGHWHLAWQNLVDESSVEVVLPPHRADIVGNNELIIELQHSTISSEDIAAREAFYGNMVWLFDATERFELISTGRRTFFSFQKTKHIELCTKPIFLDFGGTLVEVESFSEAMPKLSGFGRTRTRQWFVETFLSAKRKVGSVMPVSHLEDRRWSKHLRYEKLPHASKWIDPETGGTVLVPTDALAIPLDWYFQRSGKPNVQEWERIIDSHSELANGWTKDELLAAQKFLVGKIMVIDGFVRIMPSLPSNIPVEMSVSSAKTQLESIERHGAAGRVPILKDETKAALLEKAKKFEADRSGPQLGRRTDPQQSLF